jgi:hypothetical protein
VAAQHWRHFWNPANFAGVRPSFGIFNFSWSAIRHDSFVDVVCGGLGPQRSPLLYTVGSVSPADGGVTFVLWAESDPPGQRPVWTEITVYDPSDPSGQN